MTQTVNVNFRMDEADKKKMESVCSELGLSMSAAFTIFAKKMGREHRIPFEVSVDPFYSESNISYLEEKLAAYKAGQLKDYYNGIMMLGKTPFIGKITIEIPFIFSILFTKH